MAIRVRRAGRSEEHTSELQSHSDLHSFPTRRSSDLVAISSRNPPSNGPSAAKIRYRFMPQPSPVSASIAIFAAVQTVLLDDATDVRGDPFATFSEWPSESDERADRKSTRLNSSHTVIYTLSLHDALPIWSRSAAGIRQAMARVLQRSGIASCLSPHLFRPA